MLCKNAPIGLQNSKRPGVITKSKFWAETPKIVAQQQPGEKLFPSRIKRVWEMAGEAEFKWFNLENSVHEVNNCSLPTCHSCMQTQVLCLPYVSFCFFKKSSDASRAIEQKCTI